MCLNELQNDKSRTTQELAHMASEPKVVSRMRSNGKFSSIDQSQSQNLESYDMAHV